MKRLFITLSFIVITISSVFAGNKYDFSDRCSSGQILYYRILSSNTVSVIYPNDGNMSHTYDGYNKPTGNIIIPGTVSYNGITYSVTRIFSHTFSNCSEIKSIFIPNSVTSIDYNAFDGISISFYCAAEKRPDGWFGLSSGIITTFFNTKLNGDFAYRVTSNELLEAEIIGYLGTDSNIEIPSEIAINAYTKCKVTNIAANAFRNHTNMTGIIIPHTVKSIGSSAFYGCSGLTSIVLPISLTTIEDGAFTNCYNIESMNIKCLTPPIINSQTFLSVDKNVPVFVTCGNASVYKSTDYWKDFVTFIDNEFPYTIEVHSDDESMGNVTIRQQPSCDNTNAIIEATGTNGFIFSRWNDGNTENPRTIAVTQDTILTAFFEKYVTANISSSDNVMGYTSNNTTFFKYGETITVSAIANKGYYFTQWSDGETSNPRTLTLTGDVEFEAQFGVYQYKIMLQSNNPAMGNVSGSGTFDYNTTNTITATANPNHLFVNWSDGVTDNPRQLLLTKDTVVTAIFAKEYNDLVVKSANAALGSVTGSGTIKYRETAEIGATATAAHHHFVAWNDGNRQNPRQVTVERDTLFVATFGIDSFNIAATYNTAMGVVSGAGLYSYGSAAKVEAKPVVHHHFVRWTNGAVQTTQEFVVEHDTAFEAVFAIDRHSVALAASDSLCGAVSGAGSYDYGASVQLQATPAANCYFTGWSDGVTTNPRTLTVEGDTNIVAEFGKLQTVNIMVAANDTLRGTVAGTGSYVVGNGATLSATASAHYLFEQWSDGRTDNPRTVRVIADATYTAVFVPMQYNIILSQNNADMGMVSGSGVYSYGERVSCLAKPYPNYHFVQWSNGETSNPYEFVVEEDKMLTAYFAAGAVTAIGDEYVTEPTIYVIGKTIVVENATDEICVYDAMGKLICRDVACRVRTEIRVNTAGVYIVKTGNVVLRVVIND